MAQFLMPIDLAKNELQNARIQNLAAAPSSPVEGQIYYNTTDKCFYTYSNSTWVTYIPVSEKAAANGVASLNASSLVIQDPANASATPGANNIVKATASGKIDNGFLNTGAGNGLDADTLDGQQGAYYLSFANATNKPSTLSGYGITDAASSTHNHTLDALSNTTITSVASGHVITWNGTAWVNTAQSSLTAGNATKLTTSRTLSLSGDATGSAGFDGSANAAISVTLANSGVTAGTYNNAATTVQPFTVDAKGRITGVGSAITIAPAWSSITSKPTTLSGYGITDAYTKTEVDNLITGLDFKQSVKAATTANITLSGTQTIDGVALVAGDRVLVKNQTTATQNGIYVVASGAWSRATDADNSPVGEVTPGMYCFVEQGTANADSGWVLATDGPITIGTTQLTFSQFNGLGQITAGTGLTKSGNELSLTSGVATAGTYKSVTVDTYGRVTAGTNPTTLAGYGITDAASSTHNHTLDALSNTTITSVASGHVITWNGTAWVNTAQSSLTAGNATKLATSRTISVSGDATGSASFDGSANAAISVTLANSGVTAGTYKSVTVDAKGRVTAGTNPTTLAGYGITDAQPLDADLTAIAALAGTSGILKKTAADTWSLDTNTYLTGNQTVTLSGDATGSGTTAISVTLANSGVTAGTYNNVATQVRPFTVDAKGRITGIGTAITIAPAWSSIASKPTTISGYGITDAIRKYAANIGDGSATSITVTHSLNTMDIVATVREASTPYNVVYPDIQIIDANNIRVMFATAPSSNQFRVVVTG